MKVSLLSISIIFIILYISLNIVSLKLLDVSHTNLTSVDRDKRYG